jgi:hypothetical protein
MIETSDPKEKAKKVLKTAEKLECTRYVTPKDIVWRFIKSQFGVCCTNNPDK